MLLPDLPTELLLDVLSYLTLQDIRAICIASRPLNGFVNASADSIYHAAAVAHRFARGSDALEDVVWLVYPPRPFVVPTWRDFCRRRTIRELQWEGDGPIVLGSLSTLVSSRTRENQEYPASGRATMRCILVDAEHHTILTFMRYLSAGLIVVRALESMQVLCTMELGDGVLPKFWSSGPYLVFISHPRQVIDTSQRLTLVHVYKRAPLSARTSPERGRYAVHANIPLLEGHTHWSTGCESIRGGLFATLVHSPAHGVEVWVFDLERARCVRRFSLARAREGTWAPAEPQQELGLALSETHVCVCFVQYALIIPLGDDECEAEDSGDAVRQPPALIFPSMDMARDSGLAMRKSALQLVPTEGRTGLSKVTDQRIKGGAGGILSKPTIVVPAAAALHALDVLPPDDNGKDSGQSQALVLWGTAQATQQRFNDACFSPSGKHIALVNEFGVLYLAANFERVAQGRATWSGITTRITFPYSSKSLAWEDETRLAVQTATGIFVVNLDLDFYGIVHRKTMRQVARMPSFPRLRVRNLTLPIVVREWMSQDFRVTRSGLWAIGKVDLFARRNIAAFGYRMDPASAEEEQEVEPDRFREGSDPNHRVHFIDFSFRD